MTMERTDNPRTRAEELPHTPWRRAGEPWEIETGALSCLRWGGPCYRPELHNWWRSWAELGSGCV